MISINKILVALLIAVAVVGLTGVATAFNYADFMSSYTQTKTSWSIAQYDRPTISYSGTRTVTGSQTVTNTVVVGDTRINTVTSIVVPEPVRRTMDRTPASMLASYTAIRAEYMSMRP